MKKSNVTSIDSAFTLDAGREAYERSESAILAISADQRKQINVSAGVAVSIVLGSIPGVVQMLPALEAELPNFNDAKVARLRDAAFALLYVNILASASESNVLAAKVAEATTLRRQLLAAGDALAAFDLVPQERVDALRSGTGYLDMAEDLIGGAALLKEHWTKVKHKTPVTEEEIDRAAQLGVEILEALGSRKTRQPIDNVGLDPRELKARAFIHLDRCYDEVRRAVAYVRWEEEDADEIVPSLRVNSGRRVSRDVQEPDGEDVAPAATVTSPAPAPVATPPASSASTVAPAAGLPS